MPKHHVPGDVSTVIRSSVVPSAYLSPTYLASVTDGAARGKTFPIGGDRPSRLFVGKSPVCDIRLEDPTVSRRHAAFDTSSGNALHIVDLDSSNGTFVNGVEIKEAILRGGETIRVGETILRVDLVDPAAKVEIPPGTGFGRVVGSSTAMRKLYPRFQKLAAADVAVLIEGETGTGKEVLAESLHEASPRSAGPFIVFDCTAVPPNLLEAELFGHERGAFTGAVSARKGVFEQAHGGTLFIDEIGELDIALQPKLLRALERSEVRPVGGDKWIKVDVRVVAATRRDLDREIQDGRFRDDLFFRIAVARIELPPLRQRQGDVALLAQHFAKEQGADGAALPYELVERFERYSWPGNVRELANAISRYLALGEDIVKDTGAAHTLGSRDPIEDVLTRDLPLTRARRELVVEFERRYIARVLAAHGGNIARAAHASGIARRYFNLLLVRQKT